MKPVFQQPARAGNGLLGRRSVSSLEYRHIEDFDPHVAVLEDTVAPAPPPIEEKPGIYLTPEELNHRIATACAEATAELEMKLRKEYEAKLASVRGKIAEALAAFEEERADYYSRVESELVQLALSIAGKILHREAQVDRMLLAALTRVAVENLQQRSNVAVRVHPEDCAAWKTYFATHLKGVAIEVHEDASLAEDQCLLETELGIADVSIDAQLKEIEHGLFDLLAQRPDTR